MCSYGTCTCICASLSLFCGKEQLLVFLFQRGLQLGLRFKFIFSVWFPNMTRPGATLCLCVRQSLFSFSWVQIWHNCTTLPHIARPRGIAYLDPLWALRCGRPPLPLCVYTPRPRDARVQYTPTCACRDEERKSAHTAEASASQDRGRGRSIGAP